MTIKQFKSIQAGLDSLGINTELVRAKAKNYNCLVNYVIVKNYKTRNSATRFFAKLYNKSLITKEEREVIEFLQWHTNANKPFTTNEIVNIQGSFRRFKKYQAKKRKHENSKEHQRN